MSTSDTITPTPPPLAPAAKVKAPFEEFLLAEYQNIAQAHFNTINTISEFFKQYILIVSLPISAAVVFLKPAEYLLKQRPSVPLIVSILVVAAGLSVLGYVINLRFDAVLYARTINGIRKYFYSSSELGIQDDLRFRVLPKVTSFPRYFERSHFLFVVLTFALVGTGYLTGGEYYYWLEKGWPVRTVWLGAALCFSTHIFLYYFMARNRERAYLRSHIIGIDIDGVLNEHRAHFTTSLASQTGKQLDAESISRVPVHEIPGCQVTEQDEHAVFNWPQYWVDMPHADGAPATIRKLRNLFGYQIWIFTHRPWPQPSSFPPGRENEYWSNWQKSSHWASIAQWRLIVAIEKHSAEWPFVGRFVSGRIIRGMTKKWLQQHAFSFDKLVIERGDTYARYPAVLTQNRFISSMESGIRIFVEDILDNARKLADVCEIVFLIDHPYNQADHAELPKNLIRVKSWPEIYDFLRRIT